MAKRKVINIDLEACNGCGDCIPNCPEGALQIIDGKARLISDLLCDGLGACIGDCPQNAISVTEREAEPYNEKKVMQNIVKQGANVIKAHLEHLQEHGEHEYLKEAIEYMESNNISNPLESEPKHGSHGAGGCPGSRAVQINTIPVKKGSPAATEIQTSQLAHWPVQLHLVSPDASYFKGADIILTADCAAYAAGDFHSRFLAGKAIAIACPKLDSGIQQYVEKITAMIDNARINTLTVIHMEVPCCRGLVQIALDGAAEAARKVPIKTIVIGIQGEILEEVWL